MIAMGGVIGSGLFLSSGYTISQAGPPLGAVIAYLVGAFVVYLVMACLGELAIAYPVSGAFHIYASRSIGPATGFATAWLYWLCWAVAIGSEFTASGLLMQRWFPDIEVWVWCLVFAAMLFGFNAFSSKFFGESEFWFSIVKVGGPSLPDRLRRGGCPVRLPPTVGVQQPSVPLGELQHFGWSIPQRLYRRPGYCAGCLLCLFRLGTHWRSGRGGNQGSGQEHPPKPCAAQSSAS